MINTELKLLAIVPAYNESESIETVIKEIKNSKPEIDVLVINDSSEDNTSLVAKKSGVKVIDLPINIGIGGVIETGLKYAKKYNYDIALQIDGDGQHNPGYIDELIRPIVQKKASLVIGSRFICKDKKGFQSSRFRRLGILILNKIIKFVINKEIFDCTSGFRAFDKRIINYFSACYPNDYPEPESIVMAGLADFEILEVPVKMRSRFGGKSSIDTLHSVYYMIKVSLAIMIRKLKLPFC